MPFPDPLPPNNRFDEKEENTPDFFELVEEGIGGRGDGVVRDRELRRATKLIEVEERALFSGSATKKSRSRGRPSRLRRAAARPSKLRRPSVASVSLST